MMLIKPAIYSFSKLLVLYWDELEKLSVVDLSQELKINWLQANWELLVEGMLDDEQKIVLEIYGDGADCNDHVHSSRVLYPERLPTHRLICKSADGETMYDLLNQKNISPSDGKVIFDRLVSLEADGWYHESPPFNKILGELSGQDVVVDIEKVDIELEPILS